MHIYIKNKKLFINNYKVKCAIGKRGIHVKKKEGDYVTPKGMFKITTIMYRKDRISELKTNINTLSIQKKMGWCNDPRSNHYNKMIKFPFNFSAERLYRHDNVYDILCVLNFNSNPVRKNKGSAIFIHIAKKNYKDTEGCIAINKKDMKNIIKLINKKTIVYIN